jgi:Gluconate 2-dehydrogenase subunit 3
MTVNRREAIIRMAIMMGATVVGPRLLALEFGQDSNAPKPPEKFSADEIALLDEIGETIIPATTVPGAKAVGIGSFIAMMVTDCYHPNEQAAFREGLHGIPAAYEAKYGEKFLTGSPANRTAFLNELDQEQRAYSAKQRERKKFIRENAAAQESSESTGEIPHYFRMMKELTVLGYFTSEIGSIEVLGWVEVPGRFDGNVPYAKGDKPGTTMRM